MKRCTMIAAVALTLSMIGALQPIRSQDAGDTVVFAVGEWPPFVSEIETGYGIHPRLVTRVFEDAGYKVAYDFMPWQRAAASTKAGQYVATFPWQKTGARSEDFLISEKSLGPNLSVAYYEATRFPEGLRGTTLEALAAEGYSFVGVRSYIHTLKLTEIGARLHIVSNSELAWKMLSRGRIDIYIDNEIVGDIERVDFLGEKRAADFAKSTPISDDPLFIMFSRSHPDSRKLLEVWDSSLSH